MQTLFLDGIDDVENDIWQPLPSMERRKTALSDHLLELFEGWRTRFLGLSRDFERGYHLFETLPGVAYAEQRGLVALQEALSARGGRGCSCRWVAPPGNGRFSRTSSERSMDR